MRDINTIYSFAKDDEINDNKEANIDDHQNNENPDNIRSFRIFDAPLVDTHIHISGPKYSESDFPFVVYDGQKYDIMTGSRDEMLNMYKNSGIMVCIEPGIDFESNFQIMDLCEKYPYFIMPAIGIHPTKTQDYITYKIETVYENGETKNKIIKEKKTLSYDQRRQLQSLARYFLVTAIGETGLDYANPKITEHDKKIQKDWFRFFLGLAKKNDLPVILHIKNMQGSNDAANDALEILKKHKDCIAKGGVVHAFDGGPEYSRKIIDLGLSIGIGGKLLGEKTRTKDIEAAVIDTPMESILLETDGPYLKPYMDFKDDDFKKTYRNARNSSLILAAVAEKIGMLKGMSGEEVAKITSQNANRLFNLHCRELMSDEERMLY